MSDDKLPKIPSFAELGISEDEIEELEREIERELAGEEDDGAGAGRARETGDRTKAAVTGGAESAAAGGRGPDGRGEPRAKDRKARRGLRFGGRKGETRGKGRAARKTAVADTGQTGPGAARPADTGTATAPDSGRKAEPSAASPLWNGMRGPLTLALLLVMAWFSSVFRTVPAPVPATAPDTVFSSGRAMSHLVRIASEAHPPGSPAHAGVREYLLGQLRALGHEPLVQTATSATGDGVAVTAATVRNILARIPGTEPGGPAVLVTAHYDSRGIALGAADDASGVVAILESVRALGAGPGLRNDLIVLITDAEELGLLGARAFVDEHPWMNDVALVVAIEMRGGGGPSMMFETGADNGWVIAAFGESNPNPVANSVAYEIYRRMPNDTDFTPFKEAGRQGLNFAGVARAHVYHQVYDSPENFDEGTLQHHGIQVLAVLRDFGNADLSAVNAPDVSYISLPVVGLVTYGRFWIWVLGGAAMVLWVVALVVGRRGGLRAGGVAAGLVASVALLGAAGMAARFLYGWRRGAHPEFGALLAGDFHSEGWYVLAIVSVAFALATLVLTLLRRWFSVAELAVGALFLPVMLAGATTVLFPMAAVNFQWPVLAGCIGALAVSGLPRSGRPGHLRWVVAVLAALPVVAVLTPFTESVWLAMGMELAPVLAILAGLMFVLVLPQLDVLREPNGWWAPVVGTVAAGVFLAVGISTATPSAERPAPSTLAYLMDRETGSAWWGTHPARDDSHPGMAWAVAAVGPVDAAAAPESLAQFTAERLRYAVAAAEPLAVPPPTVEVVPNATNVSGMLRLAVTSEIGAEMLLFRLRDMQPVPGVARDGSETGIVRVGEAGPRLAGLNGRPLTGGDRPVRLTHWGTPEGAVLLDFEIGPADTVLEFAVIEHHLRPGELVGGNIFARPPELAPNIRMLSDRAMIRTVVSVDLVSGEVTLAGATGPPGEEGGEPGVGGGEGVPEDVLPETGPTPPVPARPA